MNRSSKIAFGVALALMGLTAVLLSRLQSLQRLGTPGVRVVERRVLREDGQLVGTNSVPLPERVLNLTSKDLAIPKEVSDWLPADTTYAQRVYEAPDGFRTTANVVLMGRDRTSIHKPEYCLGGQAFQIDRVDHDTVRISRPHPYDLPILRMTAHKEVLDRNGARVRASGVYLFWFVADNQLTADHNQRMWWMARDLITRGVLQRWAYVSCFSWAVPGQEEAVYARMKEWIAAAVPEFQITTGPPASQPQAGLGGRWPDPHPDVY